MERKIGEIFEYNSEWYQCVEELSWGVHCNGCDFLGRICSKLNPKCSPAHHRSDGKSVIFKKLEKVGKPTVICGKPHQKFNNFVFCDSRICQYCAFHHKLCDVKCEPYEFYLEIKQNKEDMKEIYKAEDTPLTRLVGRYVNNLIDYTTFERAVKELYSDKEEHKPTSKEFDLEAAKLGKPVCTKDGRKARIICFDLQSIEKTPIVAAVQVTDKQEVIANYYENGRQFVDGISDLDLMMFPEKKEGWVNIYKGDDKRVAIISNAYDTKEKALNKIDEVLEATYITTRKIEWEE